jgi:D-alanyl-D-alanine carboxypeptidase/D-alanyl-D-alanine-endopeptidase (penicillin-binding protein 4)
VFYLYEHHASTPNAQPDRMLYRKLRALTIVLFAMFIVAPQPTDSQTSRKKQTSSASKRKKAAKKKSSRRPARRVVRTPPAPPVLPTSPRGKGALAADMASFAARVRSGSFGIMAISVTRGDTLFTHNAGVPLVPASTLKMLTSAVAFERLGPQYRFSTDVLHDGSLGADGTINGNVYLRGDGDPALSGRYMTGGPEAPMNYLADQLVARGVKRVTGDVVGDATAFDSRTIPEGWLTRYLQSGYAARVSGLSLNENLIWVTIAPGGARLEPATSAIRLVSNVQTVAGGGARLSVRRQTDGTIIVSGRIGRNSPPRRYVYVVEDPAPFATGALHAALVAKGITVGGGIRLGKTPSGATRIAAIQSPTLDRIVAAMNRESINHFAELLLRNAARGREREIQGTAAAGQSLIRQFFAEKIRADTVQLHVADGSGLSTLDRVTPRAMTQMLSYAHDAEWGPWFHASLPVAGESELMRRRMRGGQAQGNLHAKTGTTNDVVALSGYVTAINGEVIAFTFIYNGRDRGAARSMIDVMGQTLANFVR